MKAPLNDLTGQSFGRWTVQYEASPHMTNAGFCERMWHCVCSCDNHTERDVRQRSLRDGTSTSCGCYNREMIIKRDKAKQKRNEFDLSGKYGIGITDQGKTFLFDKEDYDRVKNFCWYISTNGYVINGKEGIRLHRLIMGVNDSNLDVDHINHDLTDNRKQNLRVVSRSKNAKNVKVKSNNTSGVPGVSFDKRTNKWAVRITVDYKDYYLGEYVDFNHAVKVRKDAENKYFGEYSYDNSKKISKEVSPKWENTARKTKLV